MYQENWRFDAACHDQSDRMFVTGTRQNEMTLVCMPCPVRTECLAYALDNDIEHGVWGGMTDRARRALRRRRGEVTSWWQLLVSARREHFGLVQPRR